jgi:hypothetical protein
MRALRFAGEREGYEVDLGLGRGAREKCNGIFRKIKVKFHHASKWHAW